MIFLILNYRTVRMCNSCATRFINFFGASFSHLIRVPLKILAAKKKMTLLRLAKVAFLVKIYAAICIIPRLIFWNNHKLGAFHQRVFFLNCVRKRVQILNLVHIEKHHSADMVHIVVNTG